MNNMNYDDLPYGSWVGVTGPGVGAVFTVFYSRDFGALPCDCDA